MVCGGPASGKSSVINTIVGGFKGNKNFREITTDEDIEEGRAPESLPEDLAKIIREMHRDEKVYVQHRVYQATDPKMQKPFYVVVADGETPLTNQATKAKLETIATLVQKKNKGYEVLWVADVPILNQAVTLFKPNSDAKNKAAQHEKEAKVLKERFPKALTIYNLKYNAKDASEALWHAISKKKQDAVDALAQTTHKPTAETDKEQWQRAVSAALGNDHEAYKKAMRPLIANEKAEAIIAAA